MIKAKESAVKKVVLVCCPCAKREQLFDNLCRQGLAVTIFDDCLEARENLKAVCLTEEKLVIFNYHLHQKENTDKPKTNPIQFLRHLKEKNISVIILVEKEPSHDLLVKLGGLSGLPIYNFILTKAILLVVKKFFARQNESLTEFL